jgi:hypothetical protein
MKEKLYKVTTSEGTIFCYAYNIDQARITVMLELHLGELIEHIEEVEE